MNICFTGTTSQTLFRMTYMDGKQRFQYKDMRLRNVNLLSIVHIRAQQKLNIETKTNRFHIPIKTRYHFPNRAMLSDKLSFSETELPETKKTTFGKI